MPFLVACNSESGGEKESDSSERTARHWLYANDLIRKATLDQKRTFAVHPSCITFTPPFPFFPSSAALQDLSTSVSPCLASSLFVPRICTLRLSLCCARAGLLIRRGAKLSMPDCTPRDNETRRRRRREGACGDRVLWFQKKGFPRYSVRHQSFHCCFSPSLPSLDFFCGLSGHNVDSCARVL